MPTKADSKGSKSNALDTPVEKWLQFSVTESQSEASPRFAANVLAKYAISAKPPCPSCHGDGMLLLV
ncbi:MAG: hypothetical protein ACK58T_19555, partial [Phycisphaerae bacterium]